MQSRGHIAADALKQRSGSANNHALDEVARLSSHFSVTREHESLFAHQNPMQS